MFSLLRFLAMCAATFGFAVPAIVVAAFDRGGPRSSAIIRAWARCVLACAGADVVVHGREHLPEAGPHLLVSSHQSMLDVPALFSVLPSRTRFLTKAELFRIPLFGRAIHLLGFVPVERSDGRAARRSLDRLRDLADHDRPIVIFPEGTRSPDGSLLPFKKGAFAVAVERGLPIIPVACLGGHRAMPPGASRVRPGRITIRIGPAILVETGASTSRAALAATAHACVAALVAEGEA